MLISQTTGMPRPVSAANGGAHGSRIKKLLS
jgi:hypothetical protein